MKTKKIIALCSPHQGQLVAVTDKGEVIVAKSAEDLQEKINE